MKKAEQSIAQNIIDSLHSAVIVVTTDLMILCMNPSAEMLFDISDRRARCRSLRALILEEHEFFDRLERSLVSSHPYSAYETQLNLHNQRQIEVDYCVSPVSWGDEVEACLIIEFKHLANHSRHVHEDSILNQYEASKGLLRGLAHEIKNPLGGIRGAAQLLARELDDKDQAFTDIIIQEADRLKDLLDRMVGPRDVPDKSELNIHQLLEHVRKLVTAEHPEITITADYDPSIPELNADKSMLIQVILNLTRNAVRATLAVPERANTIHFRTRPQRNCKIGKKTHPLGLKIDIEDNGTGIDESLRENIFLPMVTGHAEGTGLGLPIAQSLVKQHDGLIEFNCTPETTVFSVLLPLNGNGSDKNN